MNAFELYKMLYGAAMPETPAAQPAAAPPTSAPAPVAPAPAPAPVPVAEKFGVQGLPDTESLYANLQEARDIGNTQRLIGNIGQAGTTINAALSGTKPDYRFDQSLIEQSAIPEKQAMDDFGLAKLEKAAQQKKLDESPNSPMNRAAQDAFMGAFPKMAQSMGGERIIRSMTHDQLSKYMVYQDKREMDEWRRRYGEQGMTLKRQQMEGVQRRYEGTALANYDTKIKPLVPAVATMQTIEQLAPGSMRGDVTNFTIDEFQRIKDRIPGGLGSHLSPDDQKALQAELSSAVGALQNYLWHPITGANLTAAELAMRDRIFQVGMLSTPEAQVAALNMFRKTVGRTLKSHAAAEAGRIPQDLWKVYEQDGGVTPNHPLFADINGTGLPLSRPRVPPGDAPALPADAQVKEPGGAVAPVPEAAGQSGPGNAEVQVTNGQETLWIPLSDLPAAEADGFRQVH